MTEDIQRIELEHEWATTLRFIDDPAGDPPGHVVWPSSPYLAANYLGHYPWGSTHTEYAQWVLRSWRDYIDTGRIVNWSPELWRVHHGRQAA